MRRVLIVTSALAFLDTFFFSVLTPLLPTYVEQLHLSDSQAGFLSGAFAWGTLAGSLPAGFLAQRLGPRPVVFAGLAILACGSLAVGWIDQFAVVVSARVLQGAAGAFVYSGAITWLLAVAPPDRRGEAIGRIVAAGGAGALLGPAVGAWAASVGTGWAFTATAVAILPICLALNFPSVVSRAIDPQPVNAVLAPLITRPMLNAVVFLTVPAFSFGCVAVLLPLKVDELDGSASLIALALIGAGVLETVLAQVAGGLSDRIGRRTPYLGGLALYGCGLALLALTHSLGVMVVVFLLATVGAGFFIVPALGILSDLATDAGVPQSLAFALSNTAFALGLGLGSFCGGLIAAAGGVDSGLVVAAAVLAPLGLYAGVGTSVRPAANSSA